MTLKEAYALLDSAPTGDSPSAVNPNLTLSIAVKIVRDAIATLGRPRENPCGMDDQIDPLSEKRVWQVVRNRKHPKY